MTIDYCSSANESANGEQRAVIGSSAVLTVSLRDGTMANRRDDTPMAARNVIGRQPASGVRIVLPNPG